jgi:hypothetical protein
MMKPMLRLLIFGESSEADVDVVAGVVVDVDEVSCGVDTDVAAFG